MRYLLAWFPMTVIAVANGAVREAWALPRQLSTILLIVLPTLYMAFVFRRLAAAICTAGCCNRLVFEFGLG